MLTYITALAVAVAMSAANLPAVPADVERHPVVRAQLTLKVCAWPEVNAGTDNDVRVKLNSANSTWLDYSRDDFEMGSEFTYDLKLDGVSTFAEVTQLRLSKTGTDGLCLKTITLELNGSKVFSKTYTSGKWLDGTALTITSAELRGLAWLAYQPPTSADFRIGNAELESRIESATGDALRTPGAEKLHWQNAPGEDVKVWWRNAESAGVDLDLRADISGWTDQNVDVDYRVNLSCMLGRPRVSTSNFAVRVNLGPVTAALVWIVDVLQDIGIEGVAVAYAIHPTLGNITAVAAIVARDLPELSTSGTPPDASMTLASAPLCPEMFKFEKGAQDGMLFKTSLRMAWSPAQLLLIGKTMTCADPPSSDTSLPAGTLIVEYRQPDGDFKRRTVKVGDADVTITADKDRDIGVTYVGEDDQGMKAVWLDYDMKYYNGNQVIQPLLAEIQTTAPCPAPAIIGTHRFDGIGKKGEYRFASRAVNWLGGSAKTARITVKTE